MSEVYHRVGGRKTEKFLAMLPEVQDNLERRARTRALKAAIILKQHRYSGDSFIEVLHGKIDWHIVLNDTRGQRAAMTIEFGRTAGSKSGPSEAVAPLRRGVGLL